MAGLFDPLKINKMQLRNRFVRSSTVDNQGRGGQITEIQLNRYRELARGEIGLILSSGLFPSQDGWAAPGQAGIHQDDQILTLLKLTQTVHENGGLIAAQLMHAGWFANPEVSGTAVVGPSAMVNPANGHKVRELSSGEVYQHVDDYVQAGRRAREAGFDGVQLHGAHGWLISAFLSPVTNRREDEWGGSAAKRAAFVIKIAEGIRQAVGQDYPVMIKLGLKDYHPQGKSLAEGIASARMLAAAGINALEVSEGIEDQPFHHIRQDARNPYYLEECREARKVLKLPLILVGGMRNLAEIGKVVEDDIADAVSMCRPFIMDPYIVKKFHQGELQSSGCTSCNGCIAEMHKGTIRCVLNREE